MRITMLFTFWLLICSAPIQALGDTRAMRCAEPDRGCPALICNQTLIDKVRAAYKNGDLVELLRHTAKDDEHPDDESTPLTPRGIEQAKAIHEGLIKARLLPSRVQVSSYLRTRQTAAGAIPRRDGQTWDEPTTLRKDQCFNDIPAFLRAESKIAGNAVYLTHSSCLISAMWANGMPRWDPTPDKHYGVMIFLNRNDLNQPIACMWPSDWGLWPKE